MKIKRFLSVFLLCACLTGLFLTPAASALDIPDIQAKAALLVDVNTDAVAYAKNIHEKNYPASLTGASDSGKGQRGRNTAQHTGHSA